MKKINAILVDDEMNNLLFLQELLNAHLPQVDVVATA